MEPTVEELGECDHVTSVPDDARFHDRRCSTRTTERVLPVRAARRRDDRINSGQARIIFRSTEDAVFDRSPASLHAARRLLVARPEGRTPARAMLGSSVDSRRVRRARPAVSSRPRTAANSTDATSCISRHRGGLGRLDPMSRMALPVTTRASSATGSARRITGDCRHRSTYRTSKGADDGASMSRSMSRY